MILLVCLVHPPSPEAPAKAGQVMQNLNTIFSGKKITQMGLGLLGRGIGDAQFLARHGAELIVTDKKSPEELKDSVAQLASFPTITLRLGAHDHADFRDRDLVLKGAGVPLDAPHIETARSTGVPVDMSASLFARIAGVPMVGVTGTRGKSTVTHLLYQILLRAYTLGLGNPRGVTDRTGLPSKPVLGGNVRGVSNLALLDSVEPDHVGVFELDSWQCQGFAEERSLDAPGVRQGPLSPQVAVFTTLMPDHMNYYGNNMELYCKDKAQIFLHQRSGDVLVMGRQAIPFLEPYRSRMQGTVVIADEATLPDDWRVAIPGIHNRYNAGLALATARALGIEDTITREAVESYRALPGRLEYVSHIRGIPVYNDNNATTPDATVVALSALDPERKKNVILIAGGADKNLSLGTLCDALDVHVRALFLIPGTGTTRLKVEYGHDDVEEVPTLEIAYTRALACAKAGDTILFSPGFASFGQYANEYERNDEFMNLVQASTTV